MFLCFVRDREICFARKTGIDFDEVCSFLFQVGDRTATLSFISGSKIARRRRLIYIETTGNNSGTQDFPRCYLLPPLIDYTKT